MFRVVVGYLVLVTFAGPWLCCCTFARLAAHASTPAVPAAPAVPSCPCCCHEDADKVTFPADEPAAPSPKVPDCPCRHGTAGQVVSLPSLSAETEVPGPLLGPGAWLYPELAVQTHA